MNCSNQQCHSVLHHCTIGVIPSSTTAPAVSLHPPPLHQLCHSILHHCTSCVTPSSTTALAVSFHPPPLHQRCHSILHHCTSGVIPSSTTAPAESLPFLRSSRPSLVEKINHRIKSHSKTILVDGRQAGRHVMVDKLVDM